MRLSRWQTESWPSTQRKSCLQWLEWGNSLPHKVEMIRNDRKTVINADGLQTPSVTCRLPPPLKLFFAKFCNSRKNDFVSCSSEKIFIRIYDFKSCRRFVLAVSLFVICKILCHVLFNRRASSWQGSSNAQTRAKCQTLTNDFATERWLQSILDTLHPESYFASKVSLLQCSVPFLLLTAEDRLGIRILQLQSWHLATTSKKSSGQ